MAILDILVMENLHEVRRTLASIHYMQRKPTKTTAGTISTSSSLQLSCILLRRA